MEERNEADSLAYQVDRQLKELGDRLPVHEKARIEQLLTDLRAALKENAPLERIRSLRSDLQQAAYSLSEVTYQQAQSDQARSSGGTGAGGTRRPGGDDVVDAEYEEK